MKDVLEDLLRERSKADIIEIRKNAQYIELSTAKDFQDIFVDNMLFGSEDL
ncbi:MAG: hypothetical protein M0P10_11935 [Sphaerochaetaceae bacterium]|nr:hypothetical protein [Sphaerochaetaceae bacterium]